MQNGNSTFKLVTLTALAGCVGLGLFGLMQFQRSMTAKNVAKDDSKSRLDGFKPLDDLDRRSSKFSDSEFLAGNSEPSPTSEAGNDESADLALDALPQRKIKLKPRSTASTASIEPFDEDPSTIQTQPAAITKAKRAPRGQLTLDAFPDDTSDDATATINKNVAPAELPPFDEEPKPITVPRNVKKQAQESIKLARRLINDGQIEEARIIAAEAAELPATFGPVEDTPEAVLADIDRLIASNKVNSNDQPVETARESISLTSGVRGNRGVGLSLDLEDATFDNQPIKFASPKSPLDDEENLFADNPPKSINGKTRLPDPPVPPAEDIPLDFPPILDDEDMPPAQPIKAKHNTESATAPNRLKSTTAVPLDPNADSIIGEGTVRADAPRGPQRPELKIEKIAPPNAALNQPMVYTIVIRNIGESSANAVVVEDQIPMGTKLSGTIPRAELTGKKLIWRLGTIKPGDQKEIQVKVVPVAEGQVGSVATVNFTAEVASRTTIAAPKLSLKVIAAPQVRVSEVVTLNFQITNNGSVDAQNVVLRNLMPENLKLADVSERDLEYVIGNIPAGKTQSVQLPLIGTRPGKAVNRAVISTEGATAAEQLVEINVIGQVVGLSRHGQTNWYVGRPVEFENRLVNNSLSPTNNTVVVESLPSGVEFVSASEGGRFDAKQRIVTWQVPHLDPNQTLPLKIKVVPKGIGNHSGSVQITENNRKGATTDYQFRAIGTSDLKIEFTEKAEGYSKGEQFTVRMVIRNKGSGAASNVAVRMTLPAELQFVSVRGPASHTLNGKEILFEPISEIGGQGNVHFDLTLKAIGSGDSKLQVELQSDQFKKPLTHEEALVIFGTN